MTGAGNGKPGTDRGAPTPAGGGGKLEAGTVVAGDHVAGRPGSTGLPADLAEALADLAVRRPDLALDVRWHPVLSSTMDAVSRAAEAGARHGLVVVAETQSAGRGRRGRAWISPPGAGLYFSYLARPLRGVDLLTLAAGVAARTGIAHATGLHADLKWPNDLLVGGRKLAGLLAEAARVGMPGASVTIGVGLNLRPAAYPPDVARRATSLEAELGRVIHRGAVFAAVLEQLADAIAALDAGCADAILQAWRAASPSAVGTPVEWSDADRVRSGITAGIDDTGALLVRTGTGTERIIAGDLQWHLRP
jgi:BirA family biotin operon repressor/biotin-[acetyl-CoA-carboxylase] ligase